jgi:transcriptional regulator with XRE-family HTH domain
MTRSERRLRVRIGNNLKTLRTSRRFTQRKLGEVSGLHWRHVQKIEKGEVNLTLHTLARCAEALQVDAAKFFENLEPKPIAAEPRTGAMKCAAPISHLKGHLCRGGRCEDGATVVREPSCGA